ncbi:hypothetical protein GGS23DRAFT_563503 [Durotheca rogersii]|uniref:uncharacterized protein n=1 Tax=Durotheca rogersii TaxID=419775 RepID=UPI00222049FE|nr:uncharacterized protein GGS23DRAFT_563503 [Durotheca rogersii]KAI5864248.1 hypothetical protein GGS23DRAFT_563503 [Durotheca rogersii]
MSKSQVRAWWRKQVAQAALRHAAMPPAPICPCEACFNRAETDHKAGKVPREVFVVRDASRGPASTGGTERDMSGTEEGRRRSHKQSKFGGVARRPSQTSMASDLVPLCLTKTTATTPRNSSDTLVWHSNPSHASELP